MKKARSQATAVAAPAIPTAKSAESTAPARLDALTGIRFFAALHVVFFHINCSAWADLPPVINALRGHGYAAVALFYVLSGFILTYTRVRSDGSIGDARRFWFARFARIWPVYLLALAWSAYQRISLQGLDNISSLIASTALLQAWWPPLVFSWNTPGWSISVEAFFYIALPFLAFPLARLQRQWHLIAAILALSAWGVASTLFCWHNGLDTRVVSFDNWSNFAAFNPLLRLPEFVIGMATGRIFALQQQAPKKWLADAAVLAGLGATMLMVALPLPTIFKHGPLLAPFFALAIWGLANRGLLARLLGIRPLVWLGDASYSLYILQVPVLDWWFQVQGEVSGVPHALSLQMRYVGILIALSLIAHRVVEMPVQRILRQRYDAWVRASPRPTARWPTRKFALSFVFAVALLVVAIRIAPEHMAEGPSHLGTVLANLPNHPQVAYDVANHDTGQLARTLEAAPHLDWHTFDSKAGQKPQQPLVLASKNWPDAEKLQAAYLDGETDDHALWALPSYGPLPPGFAVDPYAAGLGVLPQRGVWESGFHGAEGQGAAAFRWTDGNATLRLPMVGQVWPSAIDIAIGGRPGTCVLKLRVNQVEVFSGTVRSDWRRKVALTAVPSAPLLTITLETGRFRPSDDGKSGDGRWLGVPLKRMNLVR